MPKASTRTSAGAYFSRWLKKFRLDYNYTVSGLTDVTGIAERSLHAYEGNEFDPTLKHLIVLSVFSGVSIPDMVGVRITGLPPKMGGVRYNYRTGDWTAKFVSGTKGGNAYLGHFTTEQQALDAIQKQRRIHSGNPKLPRDVHTGQWTGDVRPGLGLSGPENSDVGVELPGDERPVRGRSKALRSRRAGVLPRPVDHEVPPGLPSLQEAVPRDQLHGEAPYDSRTVWPFGQRCDTDSEVVLREVPGN